MAEQRTQNGEAQRLKKSFFKNSHTNNSCHLAESKKPTSLGSLIVWNVLKAMEKNPKMDIKRAIRAAHERLADSRDMNAAICKSSEQRHFTCALLAWQQLGHSDTDSLYHFIENKIKEQEEEQNRETYSLRSNESRGPPVGVCVCNSDISMYSKGVLSASFGSDSVGPVIKLPVETQIVMRAGRMCKKCQVKKDTKPVPVSCGAKPKVEAVSSATKVKLEVACAKTRSCDSRLICLGKEIDLLRNRAAMLAKREKERVELLQRAEQAWMDLERGYQRRLMLSEEKEEDLIKQKQKAVEERDACKNSCNLLTIELKSVKENNETQDTALSDLEKNLCELSCQKLKLSEESAKIDSELAEYHCKTSQLGRDVQFKEDQARRKMQAIQNELESSQTLTNETERAMRAELCALKVQVEQVSKQLLEEDAQNYVIIKEIEDLREEKMGMVEDLEGCQEQCDSRMQGKMDELKRKQEQYAKLNERVTECRCKLPVDVVVEAKRTPSLAALCHCSPEDKVLKSCSCTSMRSRLMSSLLSDLFSGLQSEMGGAGQQMPCQMLKCLEDRHNWDKASVVKTNLENYFDKLLIGELDIAIATSIEKYHAKWVGISCADREKQQHKSQDDVWQQRAIERRAQNLAQGLAEQLFEQRAEELEQRAKDIITSGPPPCECTPNRDNQNTKPAGGKCRDEAAFPVLTSVKLCKLPPHKAATSPTRRGADPIIQRMSWRSAIQDVTKLKEQIEYLNKESIKKIDLKRMEENITRIMQQNNSSNVSAVPVNIIDNSVLKDITAKKELKNKKVAQTVEPEYYINLQRSMTQNKLNIKPKTPKPILKQSSNENGNSSRPYKKLGQNYAINMCMCSQRRAKKKLLNSEVDAEKKDNKSSKINLPPSSVKQTKPINSNLQSQSKSNRKCNGVCFHKAPSTTSIDQLLETLVKWNKDHSSSENEKEFCSLLPGGCPIGNAMNQKHKDAADTNLKSINAIGKTSPQSKHITGQIEGSRSRSDSNKSSEIKKRPSNDIDIDKSLQMKKRSSTNLSNDNTIKEPEINKSGLPSLMVSEGDVLPPTQTSQLNTEKQKDIDKDRNKKHFDNKRDIAELPLRDTDVIPPTESKYMGEINLDKSVEEVCKCSKCNNLTDSTEGLLPCLCKQKIYLKTMKDKSGDQYKLFNDKPVTIGDTKTNSNNDSIKMQRDSKTEQKPYDMFLESKKINGNKVPIGDTRTNDENKSIKMQRDSKTKNPSDSYDIKFLGVTLTDVSSQNQENTNKQYIVGEKKGSVDKDRINRETKSKDPIIMTLETKEEAGDQGDTQSVKETTSRDLDSDYKFTIETKRGKSKIYDNKCIENVFQSQQTNEDKGLSIQHFEVDEKQDTPCVCCSYKNMDDSEDLEENTFHLLEEHLKSKLQEFKQTSCNDTCIPSEEEEKLFTAILSRVKKVITEGTNRIACKCSKEEGTSQGSWNRAYGLLQEYLKTKIKRVQCSCVLAEENNDTILPDVLDKVFHLIEYDFKRLQDICGCKMALEPRNSRVCFKEELPERDEDFQNGLNTGIYNNVPKDAPTSIKKKENNSFDYEMFSNNDQNLESQQNIILDKDSIINNDRLYGVQYTKPSRNKQKYQKYNLPYAGCDCICTNFECSVNGLPGNSNETVKNVFTKPVHETNLSGKRTSILNHTDILVGPSDQLKRSSQNLNKETEPLVNKASKADKIADTDLLHDTSAQFDSINKTGPKCTCCSCTNKTTPLTPEGGFRPYIGYTIDCSCDAALGPCYCSKSVFRDKGYDMDNIFRKSLPEEKEYHVYDYKVEEGFTMDKNILQTQSLSELVNGDLFLHKILHNKSSNLKDRKDCETEASISEADGLLLKNSREYFTKTHNKTNTCDDITSLATDSSPHVSGSRMCRGVSQSDQFSNSYYNPDDFENSVDAKNENTTSSSEFQEKCSCDMVPICHVKMLVENIENRLVTANCTCDSMIPQVCPVHSIISQVY